MFFFKNTHILFVFSLALICNVSTSTIEATQSDTATHKKVVESNNSFSQRLAHSVKTCVLWPYKAFKNNLPSKRFKKAAVEASSNFNDELRVTIDDGSKHIENIVEKVDQTINEGSTQAKTLIEQFEHSLNQNILNAKESMCDIIDKGIKEYNDSRYDHYQKIENMSTVGATVIVKTVCLSACATAGALLLYQNLNHYTGSKSLILAGIGAGMLGGSGFFADKVLQTKNDTHVVKIC